LYGKYSKLLWEDEPTVNHDRMNTSKIMKLSHLLNKIALIALRYEGSQMYTKNNAVVLH
jgi:ABC-type ATPase involved in cell division